MAVRRVEDNKARRRLLIEGTRYEDAGDLLIELRGTEYAALGDPGRVQALEDPDLRRVRDALTDEPAKFPEIAERIADKGKAIAEGTLRRLLDRLCTLGWARREGAGGQRDPYRWISSTAPNP